MNADAFFTIGRNHTTGAPHVCQDYAAVMDSGCVVLADGCSSSPHTDIGARLLARQLAWHTPFDVVRSSPRTILQEAYAFLKPLQLPSHCLDTTMLVARWREPEQDVHVLVMGDGVVLARKRGGGFVLIIVEFPSGAPRYASYDLNPARRAQYFREGHGVVQVTRYDGDDVVEQVTQLQDEPITPFEFFFPKADFDVVEILSDGAGSFRRPTPREESVPILEVATEMLAFKSFAGEFITRRAQRFLKTLHAAGGHHYDDFAVAGIYLDNIPQSPQ